MSDNLRLNLWKPRKDGSGAALCFEFRDTGEETKAFVSLMPQGDGERNFNADGKITAKLGMSDIGSMLAVVNGVTEGCGVRNDNGSFKGLYHENKNGSTIIGFHVYEDKYIFSLSRKSGSDATRLSVAITSGEAQMLRIILNEMGQSLMINRFVPNSQARNTPSMSTSNVGDSDDAPF